MCLNGDLPQFSDHVLNICEAADRSRPARSSRSHFWSVTEQRPEMWIARDLAALGLTVSATGDRIIIRSGDGGHVIALQPERVIDLPPFTCAQDCGQYVAIVREQFGLRSAFLSNAAPERFASLTIQGARVHDVRIAPTQAAVEELQFVVKTDDGVVSSWKVATDVKSAPERPLSEAIQIQVAHLPKPRAPKPRTVLRQACQIPAPQSPNRGRKQAMPRFQMLISMQQEPIQRQGQWQPEDKE
jgi:hypothetical protein